MKKNTVLLLFILTCSDVIAQWTKVYFPDTNGTRSTYPFFINKDTGFMAMSNYLKGAFIYKTEDRGKSWKNIVSFKNKSQIYSIYFFNQNEGIIRMYNSSQTHFSFYSTNDGGKTWDSIPKTRKYGSLKGFFNTQLFTIDVGGAIAAFEGPLFKSKNKGKTWYKVSDYNIYLDQLQFTDSLHGYCLYNIYHPKIDSLFLLHTKDGGDTWQKDLVSVKSSHNQFLLAFSPNYIVAEYNPKDSVFMISHDDGKTWNNEYNKTSLNNYKVILSRSVTDSSTMYLGDVNSIYKSIEKSYKFTKVLDSFKYYFNTMEFFNKDIGIADCGADCNEYMFWLITNSSKIKDTTSILYHPKTFEVLLYPNPSSIGIINLCIEGIIFSEIYVSIKDIFGRQLISQTIRPNAELINFSINTSQLACGTYIISIQQGNSRVEKKFVVE